MIPLDMEKAMIGSSVTENTASANAEWWEPRGCGIGLSPGSCCLKSIVGTAARLALQVLDVSASEKCAAWRIVGGTAEGSPFVPVFGMRGYFLCN